MPKDKKEKLQPAIFILNRAYGFGGWVIGKENLVKFARNILKAFNEDEKEKPKEKGNAV